MRTGPRVLFVCVLASAALCSSARAADTLNVYVDNNQIALGAGTTLAAHVEADAAFGGGHIEFKFKPADSDCRATSADDDGSDASADPPQHVAAGAGVADVGGQTIQLDVGNWVVCGWLIDDTNAGVAAAGSTVVQVVPYIGSISPSIRRVGAVYQVVLSWSTSSAATLYAWLQPAAKNCPMSPSHMPKRAIPVVPRSGRLVGSDGGLGHPVKAGLLTAGRWRMCAWLRAVDSGGVGPVTKTFSVPKRQRRAGHAAG